MASELHSASNRLRVVQRIAEFGRLTLGSDEAAVSIVTAGARMRRAAGTSSAAEQLEDLQQYLGEGPGATALSTGTSIVARELVCDERWPNWGRDAGRLGLHSALSVPLQIDGRPLAVLGLYSTQPGAFRTEHLSAAVIFSRHAAVALAAAHDVESLRRAVDTRTAIGQAEGILMERYGLDAERAFNVLRRYSQELNVKVRELAEQLVETRSLPDEALPRTNDVEGLVS